MGDLIVYVCPECGTPVSFYPGFVMTCGTRGVASSHAFKPAPNLNR